MFHSHGNKISFNFNCKILIFDKVIYCDQCDLIMLINIPGNAKYFSETGLVNRYALCIGSRDDDGGVCEK